MQFKSFLTAVISLLLISLSWGQSRPNRSSHFASDVLDITVPEQQRSATAKARALRTPVDVSTLFGLSAGLHSAEIKLANPDPAVIQQIREEDAANPQNALRVGFTRPTKIELVSGEWNEVADQGVAKRVWLLNFESPDAVALRIHFRRLDLPRGVTLKLYTVAHAAYPLEYTGKGPNQKEEFWSEPIFGARVQFELVDGRPDALTARLPTFEVDSVAHWFDGGFGASAACELNYACYSAWKPTGNSVARIYFMDNTGAQYVCSGTLLANVSNDFTPYFLTAHHCIADSYQEMTMVAYWLDQSSVCNGTAPDLASLKTSSSQERLSTSLSTDQVLLLLAGSPPVQVPFAGWTTAKPNTGLSVTGIHHPHGDPTKISFGSNAGASLLDGIIYWTVNWTSGITEPGSSGSPLFTPDHLLIGTDSLGSFVSCSNKGGPAYYGSFRDGFTSLNDSGNNDYLIRGMMGRDKYSPNNSQATAAQLALPTPVTNLKTSAWEPSDYFSVVVPAHKGVGIYTKSLASSGLPISVSLNSSANGSFYWTMKTDDSGLGRPHTVWNLTDSDDTMYLQISTNSQISQDYKLGVDLQVASPPVVMTTPDFVNVTWIQGIIVANGMPTTAHVEYSFSGDFSNPLTTPDTQVSQQGEYGFSTFLMNIPLDQPFAYRLVASNSAGTTYGKVISGVVHAPSPVTFLTANQQTIYFHPIAPGEVMNGWFPFDHMGTDIMVNNITMTGDSAFVPPATPCSLAHCWGVNFAPQAEGSYSGTVKLDLANGQTFTFNLVAVCIAGSIPDGLQIAIPNNPILSAPIFGSDMKTYTLTNSQSSPVVIYGVAIASPHFSQANDCPTTLPAGASCHIYVTFHPLPGFSPTGSSSLIVYSQTTMFTTVIGLGGQIGDRAAVAARPYRGARTN